MKIKAYLEPQLKDYYNKHCRKAKLRVQDQNGNAFKTDHQIDLGFKSEVHHLIR